MSVSGAAVRGWRPEMRAAERAAAAGARLRPSAPPADTRCGGRCRLGLACPSCCHTMSEPAAGAGSGGGRPVPADGRPARPVTLGRVPRAAVPPAWSLLVLICISACAAAARGDLFDSGQLELERHSHPGIRYRRSVDNMTGECGVRAAAAAWRCWWEGLQRVPWTPPVRVVDTGPCALVCSRSAVFWSALVRRAAIIRERSLPRSALLTVWTSLWPLRSQ